MQTFRALALFLPLCLVAQAGFAEIPETAETAVVLDRFETVKSECRNLFTKDACSERALCVWNDETCQIADAKYAREVYANCFLLATAVSLAIVIPVTCLVRVCRMLS